MVCPLLGICFVVSLGILFLICRLPATLDPQGGSNHSCVNQPLMTVPGSQGMLVSGHQTLCGNFIHDSAIYLFLYKAGGIDNPASPFFRYDDDPLVDPPKVRWISDSKIKVSAGDVVQITKILPSIDGISIEYSIG